jgi:acetylornithine aminotransferase
VLQTARAACDRYGALLVADEVQTGVGRLGTWYAWQGTDVVPDVMCLAKALANGLPVGAVVAHGEAAGAFGPGDHASTFGGGPVVTAAALAVFETIEKEGLIEHAAAMGTAMTQRLKQVCDRVGVATAVRGKGLLQALVLAEPVAEAVVTAALDHGLVVNDVAPDAIRLAPALLINEAELDEMAGRLEAALQRATQDGSGGTP